ncbi:MAG: hypothetical protein AAB778_04000 [Patescibacteria group bacterium]
MLSILTLNKPNIRDFAKERNELLKKSKSEWVLFVDQDEIVPENLKNEISKAILNKNYNGYFIKRKIFFCGIPAGEDRMLKLGRKNAGQWKRKVHEYWNIKGNVGILSNYIIHNTALNLKDYIQKVNDHSTLHANEVLGEGKRSSLIRIIIYSIGNFVVYLFKSRNIVFSLTKSLHSYLSWTKLYFLQH